MHEEYLTHSEEETVTLACEFAQRLERGDVIALLGELGAGKTRFVKGVCEAFGANRHVSSPSFVILNRYEGTGRDQQELFVYHLDLYRVKSAEEIYDLGYEEFVYGDGITLIEWAEQLGDLLPPKRYDVRLAYGQKETERTISIESLNAGAGGTESRKVSTLS
jgi:tRNA threonylcarbamoyladenosine biosynthesis protein TsaE